MRDGVAPPSSPLERDRRDLRPVLDSFAGMQHELVARAEPIEDGDVAVVSLARHDAAKARSEPPSVAPLQREVARVARLLSLLAFGLAGAFSVVGISLGMGTTQVWLFAVGVLVANVPEGLLPTTTLALAMASQRMASRRVLVLVALLVYGGPGRVLLASAPFPRAVWWLVVPLGLMHVGVDAVSKRLWARVAR
ncbi:MAG: cation-transporting P-type ATPase [Deltaproteobacteria bacterium]|nr:cation-transporting P-type ATPase [Deltaproteobacteria bacterium]